MKTLFELSKSKRRLSQYQYLAMIDDIKTITMQRKFTSDPGLNMKIADRMRRHSIDMVKTINRVGDHLSIWGICTFNILKEAMNYVDSDGCSASSCYFQASDSEIVENGDGTVEELCIFPYCLFPIRVDSYMARTMKEKADIDGRHFDWL